MNKTAFVFNSLSIGWFSILVALACVGGLLLACVMRKLQKGSVNDILILFCVGVPWAVLLARLQYCLSKVAFDQDGIWYIFTGMRDGGYGLYGAMLGVLLAAFLTAKICKTSFGELADCAAAAGAGVITAGRFATEFTYSEMGFSMAASRFTRLDKSGVDCLAVYLFDGAVEAVIFAVCLFLFVRSYLPKQRRYSTGAVALVFVLLHGLNQVVMDSLRVDMLYLFDNPFIKCSQIIGILSWLAVILIFAVRAGKKHRLCKWHWLAAAVFVGLIVLSIVEGEYRVGSSNYVSAHVVMGVCMVIMAVISLYFFALSEASAVSAAPKAVKAANEQTDMSTAMAADTAVSQKRPSVVRPAVSVDMPCQEAIPSSMQPLIMTRSELPSEEAVQTADTDALAAQVLHMAPPPGEDADNRKPSDALAQVQAILDGMELQAPDVISVEESK